MPRLAVIVPILLAAGCAAQQSEIASVSADAGQASPGTAPTVIAPAENASTAAALQPEGTKKVEISDFEDGLVCDSHVRTGSRMRRRTCYSREEYAAIQAAKEEQALQYLDDLAREQNMLGIQQQAIEEQQRRAMAGQ
jgi:hypothetical protein